MAKKKKKVAKRKVKLRTFEVYFDAQCCAIVRARNMADAKNKIHEAAMDGLVDVLSVGTVDMCVRSS